MNNRDRAGSSRAVKTEKRAREAYNQVTQENPSAWVKQGLHPVPVSLSVESIGIGSVRYGLAVSLGIGREIARVSTAEAKM